MTIYSCRQKYSDITFFDCFNRIKELKKFKLLLNSYEKDKNQKNSQLKSEINEKLLLVEEYLSTAYVQPYLSYKSPHINQDIRIFWELFNPHLCTEDIIQNGIYRLDMALGRYKSVLFKSFVHTISPRYWFSRFSCWLTTRFLSSFKIEQTSKTFSITKFFIELTTWVTSIAKIYNDFGLKHILLSHLR